MIGITTHILHTYGFRKTYVPKSILRTRKTLVNGKNAAGFNFVLVSSYSVTYIATATRITGIKAS